MIIGHPGERLSVCFGEDRSDPGPRGRSAELVHRNCTGVDAAAEYRRRLEPFHQRSEKPDGLAARRLSIHVRHVEGDGAAVVAFASECAGPLKLLGLLDDSSALAQALLETVADASVEQAVLLVNLGNVLQIRGDLDGAREHWLQASKLFAEIGMPHMVEEMQGLIDGLTPDDCPDQRLS